MDEMQIERLKLEINNFLWMNAKATTTLGELEEMALKILEMLTTDKKG